jgi:hypothetical protein
MNLSPLESSWISERVGISEFYPGVCSYAEAARQETSCRNYPVTEVGRNDRINTHTLNCDDRQQQNSSRNILNRRNNHTRNNAVEKIKFINSKRQAKNLRRILCNSRFRNTNTYSIHKCSDRRCETCPYIKEGSIFKLVPEISKLKIACLVILKI